MATATLSASPVRTSHRSRAEALARLIAAQQADAKCHKLKGSGRECDLAGPDEPGAPVLDRIADPRATDPAEAVQLLELDSPTEGARRRAAAPVYVAGLSIVWDVAVTRYDPRAGRPCPGCHDRPPRAGCVVCSASHQEPRKHPMIGTRPLSARVYRRAKGKAGKVLAGGIGA